METAFIYDSTPRFVHPCVLTPSRNTGKERDTESGNDYFEARYYSSSMGRFMSPDWSAKEDPVPYAQMDDPQSLNLYSYVKNNPLSHVDADGHCCDWDSIIIGTTTVGGAILGGLGGGAAGAGAGTLVAPGFGTIGGGYEGVVLGGGGGALIGAGIGHAIVNAMNSSSSSGEAAPAPATTPAAPVSEGESVPSAPTMGAAQREGMRDQGIPTSQQPASQQNTAAGKQYTYVVPKPGGGTETKVAQRNTGTDSSHPGQPHVEVGRPKASGATDSIGRPRLDSNKTKVNVKPNGQ